MSLRRSIRFIVVRINYIIHELFYKFHSTSGKAIGVVFVEIPGPYANSSNKLNCNAYKSYIIHESISSRLFRKG